VDQVSPPPPPLSVVRMCHLPCLSGEAFRKASFGNADPPYPILGYWQGGLSAWAVEKSIYSAEYQRLCGLLRQLRHEAGLTQVQVAARLGVPQSFVSKYESGERRLDVVELGHVAGALGVTVREVLDRLEGQEPGDQGRA
jgi:DNA-binding XRE family transcriptional regulator